MGNTLRSIGSIAVGVVAGFLGPGAFSATQFALGTFLFSALFPPKMQSAGAAPIKPEATRGTAVNTAIWDIYGKYERTSLDLIRCGLDKKGRRTGIKLVIKKKEVETGGGIFGGSSAETTVRKEYLQATFGCCSGPTYIDRIIEVNSKQGEVVIWNRYGETNEKKGLQDVTPVYSSYTGELIAEITEHVRMYYGFEDQPIDDIEASWHPEGVSADRGLTKIVFNSYGPLQSGTTFRVLLRNARNGRREIIKARLMRAGVPESRIYLRSIDPDAKDVGWFSDSRQPARELPEMVAAKSFHDLHVMAVGNNSGGLGAFGFTDISRVNPTYVQLSEGEYSAFNNTKGDAQAPPRIATNVESSESSPRELSIPYYDEGLNFNNTAAHSLWTSATGEGSQTPLPCVANAQEMQDLADITHAELMGAKGTRQINLMPHRCQVAPGVVLIVPVRDKTGKEGIKYFRILGQDVGPEGILNSKCLPYDPAAYGRHKSIPDNESPEPEVEVYADPLIDYIDSVSLVDAMAEGATVIFYGWAPRDQQYAGYSITSRAFDPFDMETPATVGTTLNAYSYDTSQTFGYDYFSTIRVDVGDYTLASSDEERCNERANLAILMPPGSRSGVYFNYVNAVPVAGQPGVYDLSGILPGRKGSDLIRTFPIGSRFVLITDENAFRDSSLVTVRLPLSRIRVPIKYEAFGIEAPKYSGEITTTANGNTLVALSVSPNIDRFSDGAGGYVMFFRARTRYAESEEALWSSGMAMRWSDPLNFTLRLLNGATVLHTQTVIADPLNGIIEVPFTQAQLQAIYGSVPLTMSGDIFQQGTYGPGEARAFLNI
jgi:hypothetical protein